MERSRTAIRNAIVGFRSIDRIAATKVFAKTVKKLYDDVIFDE